jgi:hypothetical protein
MTFHTVVIISIVKVEKFNGDIFILYNGEKLILDPKTTNS